MEHHKDLDLIKPEELTTTIIAFVQLNPLNKKKALRVMLDLVEEQHAEKDNAERK